MKILLLGGTGAMGVHLGKILAEKKHQVFITSRKSCPADGNIQFIQGNAHDDHFIHSLLTEQWDVIVDFMIYNTSEFEKRLQGLLAGTRQYIFLSSSRVYAESVDPITEDSPRLLDVCQDQEYLKTDEYALTKARQEDMLRNSGARNWTIVRPYITFGEARLQLGTLEKEHWLAPCLWGMPIVFSKDIISKKTTLTYGYDVARGIAALCGQEEALGEAFHITGSQSFTWQEIFDLYLDILEKHLGRRPPVLLTEKSMQLSSVGKYQVLYDRLYDRTFDNSKICRFMPEESFHDVLEKLRACLEAFLVNPTFLPIGVAQQAQRDRICKVHTPLHFWDSWKKKIKYLLARYIIHV